MVYENEYILHYDGLEVNVSEQIVSYRNEEIAFTN